MPPNTNVPRPPKVRRYHWYTFLVFIIGTLFPPLAVAARFGIGKDFWLNVLLTIAGYIPGHAHNFYIQNIRNNKTHHRTPKWALRYGLVDGSTIRRHEQRSQWAGRYKDRNLDSGYDHQPLEEGQLGPSRTPTNNSSDNHPRDGDGLWRPEDESYYSAEPAGSVHTSESGKRWRYPANFDDSLPEIGVVTPKKKKKKDRWARTEDAYSAPGQKKKKKKKSKNRSTVGGAADANLAYSYPTESTTDLDVPEEATGQVYGRSDEEHTRETGKGSADIAESRGDEFNHEF